MSSNVEGRPQAARAFVAMTLGLGALWGVERAAHRLLEAFAVRFPSSVAGMLLSFALLLALRGLAPRWASRVATALEPARRFLARWMALFFVPPLVLLPLTPLPAARDLVFSVGIMTLGFGLNLVAVAKVAGIRGHGASTAAVHLPGGYAWSRRGVYFFWGVVTTAGVAGWFLLGDPLYVSVAGVGFAVGFFLLGEELRQKLTNLGSKAFAAASHPVLVSAAGTCATWRGLGLPLEQYLSHQRGLDPSFAGNMLMALLAPSVVSLGLALDAERALLRRRAVSLVGATVFGSLFSLFSTALLARGCGLSTEYGRALLSRSVTTPVALVMAQGLDANPGLTAAFVICSGVLGALFSVTILRRVGVREPFVVGVATGAASHGIGTAALVREFPQAAAASAISFALTAALSVTFLSVPHLRFALLAIVGQP